MRENILALTGQYHFGDNVGLFQGATYVGHVLSLPLHLTWTNENAEMISLFFETHDLEIWGEGQGHRVLLNDTEVGRLKDPIKREGELQTFEVKIPYARFRDSLQGFPNLVLTIALEVMRSNAPELSDDFVLTRLETKEIVLKAGWRSV